MNVLDGSCKRRDTRIIEIQYLRLCLSLTLLNLWQDYFIATENLKCGNEFSLDFSILDLFLFKLLLQDRIG